MPREMLFAMEATYLDRYLDRRENLAVTDENIKALFGLPNTDQDDDDDYEVDADGVAHVVVSGPLSQDGPDWIDKLFGFGGTAYSTIIDQCTRSDVDSRVKSVQLDMNTPGGSVTGMDNVWTTIRNLTKPSAALNCGMIASAGYLVASACGSIRSTSPLNQTGSIGVQYATVDYSKAMEGAGVKEIVITSGNAPLKNADPATKAGREAVQAQIDALERGMFARIAEGRGVSTEYVAQAYGRGAMLIDQDADPTKPSALSARMIDGIGKIGTVKGPAFGNASAAPAPKPVSQSPAAVAGNKPLEVPPMTLAEFLAANPDAQAALDKIKADSFAAGEKAAVDRVTKARAIVESDAYPKAIKALAFKAMAAEVPISALDSTVASFDAYKEGVAEEAAKAESLAAEEAKKKGVKAPVDPSALTVEAINALDYEATQKLTADQLKAIYADAKLRDAYEARVTKGGL